MSNPAASQPTADRSKWTNLIVFAAIVVVVFAIFRFRPFGDPAPESHDAVGRKVPVVEIEPLTGGAEPVTREGLRGKVVLLNFWATSYPVCREHLPRLAAIADEFADEADFKLLAVSCGAAGPEDPEILRRETEKVLKELKLDLPTYGDPTGATQESFRDVARFNSVPTTYLLDRDLTIRGVWEGYREGIESQMKELIEKQLEKSE